MIEKITFIGSGNVASHLASVFYNRGIKIVEVCSRTEKNAMKLANRVGAEASSSLNNLSTESDFYIIAVSDDAISQVQSQLPEIVKSDKIVAHTSGFNSINVLSEVKKASIFYPLNTFTADAEIDFNETPFFLDSKDEEDYKSLEILAGLLTDKIHRADDKQRAQLHIAAVLASNFSMALYDMADTLLDEVNLPLEVLAPLMRTTVEKAIDVSTKKALTGPAKRGDEQLIEQHLRKLENNLDIKEVYTLMTEYIEKKMK